MLVLALGSARAFVASPANAVKHYQTTRRVASPPRLEANGLFESAGWPSLQGTLDELPVFTVANGEGQPLEYTTAGPKGERQLAIFYIDVEAAMKQTTAAKAQFPDLGCDIISTGLGFAFKLSSEGGALIVPGVAELQGAGAPEGSNPMGQEVPLFCSMELTREGGKVLLFMSYADCAEAVSQAPGGALEVDTILSLQSTVEELADLEDPSSGEFVLVAPSASLQHVASYVGQGVYMRKVEEGE